MRADARKHLNKSFCIITRALAFLSGSIHEYHHLADRSVESECLEILCNFLNSLMIYFLQSVICIFNDILRFSEEIPYFTDKSSRTFNALLAPWFGSLKRSHEHLVKSQCISTVISYDITRIDDKFRESLTHLNSVGSEYHALMHKFLKRLPGRCNALIIEVSVPDS